MNTIIEQMLAAYEGPLQSNERLIVKEIVQEMVLCGLSRAGFFKEAAFYGGTALRMFYRLDRFSEDLDFSLRTKNERFDLNVFLPTLAKEMASFGLNVDVSKKVKNADSHIQSAFLKGNTQEHLLLFYGDEMLSRVHADEKIRIKFEVDTNPPDFARFEYRYRLLPSPYEIALYDPPSLFAGKIHAVLCRAWRSRIKGRDLYDYVFFLARRTPVNVAHLRSRLEQSGYLQHGTALSLAELKRHLAERFDAIDFVQAKSDIVPFIRDDASLRLWSADFFKQITAQLTAV